MSDARTPADIEADILRRRQELAVALDEIAVRVHPRTLVDGARAKVARRVDRTTSRAFGAAFRAVHDVRATLLDEDGRPRLDRVVPVAVVAVVVVGGLYALTARRRRS